MIHQSEFKAMGCQMMAALEYPAPRARDLLARVPAWFEEWEACLSRFRPESELSKVNRKAGAWTPVSTTLWKVLLESIQAERFTNGLVTPTLLTALNRAGYTASFEDLPREQAMDDSSPEPAAGLRSMQLEPETRSLNMPVGMQLDFGGVAKGWAAHQAMKRLQAYGPALVDAGGDIAISGVQTRGEPWPVGIQDPRDPGESLGTLLLGRCGVATSGTDFRHWKKGGVEKHHIIDPRRGEPAETDILSATVIASTVMEAEAAAKAVVILGSQEGRAWLEARPGLAGLVVTSKGEIQHSSRFETYLEKFLL
jgi:thiamine biosynthesis lipoprotein